MKVVINDCHGGFGLSTEAVIKLIEYGSGGIIVKEESEYNGHSWNKADERDVGQGYRVGGCLINDVIFKDGKVYYYDDGAKHRTDPALVRVVEEMGSKASDPLANLKVVEIPDDVDWYIEYHDGLERVAEKHRTWP